MCRCSKASIRDNNRRGRQAAGVNQERKVARRYNKRSRIYYSLRCHSDGPQAQRNLLFACSTVTAGIFLRMNPVATIIVPARNEEANLAACLASLVTQTGVAYEIIVVDDDSTDRTAEIAGSFPGVKLIPAGPLPDNWTGKNNAMFAGAKA